MSANQLDPRTDPKLDGSVTKMARHRRRAMDPLMTVNEDTFISDALALAGAENALAGGRSRWRAGALCRGGRGGRHQVAEHQVG
jgi:hypothetical protein